MLAHGRLAHTEDVGEVTRARAGLAGECHRDPQPYRVSERLQAHRIDGNISRHRG